MKGYLDVSDISQHKRRAVCSDSSRALMKERARERGQHRSEDVRKRILRMMTIIEEEMAGNEGIYPRNMGALSSTEVARRAGVHPTTLFSPKQRELGAEVRQWLTAIKTRKLVGRGPVQHELAARVSAWKRLYDGLAQAHRDTALELQRTIAELTLARDELAALQRENVRLRKLIGSTGGAGAVCLPSKEN